MLFVYKVETQIAFFDSFQKLYQCSIGYIQWIPFKFKLGDNDHCKNVHYLTQVPQIAVHYHLVSWTSGNIYDTYTLSLYPNHSKKQWVSAVMPLAGGQGNPEFGSSANPITTRWQITASPPGFENPAASLIGNLEI